MSRLSDEAVEYFEKVVDGQMSVTAGHSSHVHKLHQSLVDVAVLSPENDRNGKVVDTAAQGDLCMQLIDGSPVIVVEHRWDRVIQASDDDEWRLPFETCVFEFRINGHNVCILSFESDERRGFFTAIEMRSGWIIIPVCDFEWCDEAIYAAIVDIVRASCIAMDANVVTKEIAHAPDKLNRARRKKGLSQMRDHYALRITSGKRDGDSTGEALRKVRLHFRRGHWRRYDDHRKWINWTLVGDPDLGIINKHYRM